MRKTVMIFGASSFIGSNLALGLKGDFRIIGTYHNTPIEIPGITCVPCDVFKKDYVTRLVNHFKPDFCIYAVGMNSLKECQLKPKHSDALNTTGAVNVCLASERHSARFVLISSGYVMGGENIMYKEGDLPFPSTNFGSSMSQTEFYTQRSCLNYLILRCCNLYGRSYNPLKPNLFESVQASLVKNELVQVDGSTQIGFLDIDILAKILKATFTENVTNRLFHVSSSDFMTRYEFALEVAKAFKLNSSLVQKTVVPFPAEKNIQRKPGDFYYKLDNTNIEGFLGAKMPTVAESLFHTHKRLGNFA